MRIQNTRLPFLIRIIVGQETKLEVSEMNWENVLKEQPARFGEFGYPVGDERNEKSRMANERFTKKIREISGRVAHALSMVEDLEVVRRKTDSGLEKPIGGLFDDLAELLEAKADFIMEALEIEGDTLGSRRTRASLDEGVKNMRELAKKFRAKS